MYIAEAIIEDQAILYMTYNMYMKRVGNAPIYIQQTKCLTINIAVVYSVDSLQH